MFRAQRNLACWQQTGYSGPNSLRSQDDDSTRERRQTDLSRQGNDSNEVGIGWKAKDDEPRRGLRVRSRLRSSSVYRYFGILPVNAMRVVFPGRYSKFPGTSEARRRAGMRRSAVDLEES